MDLETAYPDSETVPLDSEMVSLGSPMVTLWWVEGERTIYLSRKKGKQKQQFKLQPKHRKIQ